MLGRLPLAAALAGAVATGAAAQSTITKTREAGVTVYRGSVAREGTSEIKALQSLPPAAAPETFTGASGVPRSVNASGTSYLIVRNRVLPLVILKGNLKAPPAPARSGVRQSR